MSLEISWVTCECLLMVGKVCPWVNILVILCAALGQSRTGHHLAELGQGPAGVLRGRPRSACASRERPQTAPTPMGTGHPGSPGPWPWHVSGRAAAAVGRGHRRKEMRRSGWAHGWTHTLWRMFSLPEEGLLRDHGCGWPTLGRAHSQGTAAIVNPHSGQGKQGRSREWWRKMKQKVAKRNNVEHSPYLLLWPLPHQRGWEGRSVTRGKTKGRWGQGGGRRGVGLMRKMNSRRFPKCLFNCLCFGGCFFLNTQISHQKIVLTISKFN